MSLVVVAKHREKTYPRETMRLSGYGIGSPLRTARVISMAGVVLVWQ